MVRLPPDAFWRLTPRELDAIAAPWLADAGATPSRAVLDALMDAFPDKNRRG